MNKENHKIIYTITNINLDEFKESLYNETSKFKKINIKQVENKVILDGGIKTRIEYIKAINYKNKKFEKYFFNENEVLVLKNKNYFDSLNVKYRIKGSIILICNIILVLILLVHDMSLIAILVEVLMVLILLKLLKDTKNKKIECILQEILKYKK